MDQMQALQVADRDQPARLVTLPLPSPHTGEIVIRSRYSSVNYKDALAVTGRGRILKTFPMVPGIDVAGEVLASEDERFAVGDQVLVTGRGLGERFDGGYAEQVLLPANSVVSCPESLGLRGAMMYGTAGFTAALAIHRMSENHQHPDDGPIAITGATGGVGSIAIMMLAGLGYQVVAITGKPQEAAYLCELGAAEVIDYHDLKMGKRPLESVRWAGAVDTVGGEMLAWLTRTVQRDGNIACIGLAAGHELHTTVMPFILRGVSLLGISSVDCGMTLRRELWRRMAGKLKPAGLERIVSGEIGLADIPAYCEKMLEGEITGRCLVRFD